MLSPSSFSVPQGSAQPVTVQTTLSAGSAPQSLALSVSGLPMGASAVFAPPNQIPAGGTAILTIYAGNAPAGAYTVTVNAVGPFSSHTSTLTMTVTASDFGI